jgi:hypothetical protein
MTDNAMARMDDGDANRRILSKQEFRADFRRVEAASIKRRTHLCSGEAKRLMHRCFYSLQASVYLVSALGRTKLPDKAIDLIEAGMHERMQQATDELNKAIDGAEALFKANNIDAIATYDTVPLELDIGITSALGRKYFELIHKLDQLMPMLATLEIEEVLSERQVARQRSLLKRRVFGMQSWTRSQWLRVQEAMNNADANARAAEAPPAAAVEAVKADVVAVETVPEDAGPAQDRSAAIAVSVVDSEPPSSDDAQRAPRADSVSGEAFGEEQGEEQADTQPEVATPA